jgi:SAM-dependent methyltransferase
VQIDNVPSDLAEHYGGYRLHGQDSSLYRTFRNLIIGHCYPLREAAGSLLDFGCGNGWFLKEMQKRGWKTTGYEVDSSYARELSRAIGVPVLSGEEELRARAGAFDLVTLNFSFEHLDRPRDVLRLVADCLRPGGSIYLSVPNIESLEARLFSRRWFHLDPPRHISFFSKAMLSQALVEAGFDRIRVKDLPVPTGFAGSLSYCIFGRFNTAAWYTAMLPGMLFSSIVRDGNFAITGSKP